MNDNFNPVKYLLDNSDKISILYAEDEEKLRDAVSRYLLRYFKSVDIVSNGQEAYDKYLNNPSYDLIITDLQMPIMSGMELIDKIKTIDINQEMIIISAFSEQEKLMKAIALGINGYILKPIDFKALNTSLYNSIFKINSLKKNQHFQNNLINMVENKTQEIVELSEEKLENLQETIFALVDLIEKRDTYTAGHSGRVAHYSVMIADALHCSIQEIELLEQAAMLHDIGKVTTPDAILLKPWQLDKNEYELIQEHVQVGYELLSQISMYSEHAKIINAHHEHYDGMGYPNGLKGDAIPKLSKIMTIADSFDAMTTQRIYKSKKSIQEAIEELEQQSGKHFDPQIIKVAVEVLKNIVLPKDTTQLPKNNIEKERYAYYFKDNLCNKLYNDRYFEFIINQNILLDSTYDSLIIFKINNLNAYNKKHSWKAGNEIIVNIAEHLIAYSKKHTIFRLRGDIFLTFLSSSENEGYLDYLLQYDTKLSKLDLEAETKQVKLTINDITSIDDMEAFL